MLEVSSTLVVYFENQSIQFGLSGLRRLSTFWSVHYQMFHCIQLVKVCMKIKTYNSCFLGPWLAIIVGVLKWGTGTVYGEHIHFLDSWWQYWTPSLSMELCRPCLCLFIVWWINKVLCGLISRTWEDHSACRWTMYVHRSWCCYQHCWKFSQARGQKQ